MPREYFVKEDSIVRQIWGKMDTVLFIFAAASAEFALNKAVHWLYFTGKLPSDPIDRLLSTVSYAQRIIFSFNDQAISSITSINRIHAALEEKREQSIPQWAYRDVLYMLIDYSITVFELLERRLSTKEKEEVYDVFFRLGISMNIEDLPVSYAGWLVDRVHHLNLDLEKSVYTEDLYRSYKQHLGNVRYYLLRQVQCLICPSKVVDLINIEPNVALRPAFSFYKILRVLNVRTFLTLLFVPEKYKKDIKNLNILVRKDRSFKIFCRGNLR